MGWTRRDLLRAVGGCAAMSTLPLVSACGRGPAYVYDGPASSRTRFQHGVASGDPLTDSVILWTHVDLARAETQLEVYVEVSDTDTFDRRVAAAYLTATAKGGGSVKVDLEGLEPGRTYFYRFRAQDQISPVGRTRTAPAGPVDSLTVGLMSCSNYGAGWFHAYRAMAERDDVELVLHAGDYIYEGGGGRAGREVEPPYEVTTLDDYRTRYAHYRRDPDLQALHAAHPVIATWDDHESANNTFDGGADGHNPATDGPWEDRLAAARQAWFEWLPAREGAQRVLYRKLAWGDLAELIVLDSRVEGRDEQTRDAEIVREPDRQLLGDDQEEWLLDRLGETTSTWSIVLQQVVFAPWGPDGTIPLNPDQWDGYPAARKRIVDTLATRSGNTVILTGDIHSSWAFDIPLDFSTYDPAQGGVAIEAVTPGVTSSGIELGDVLLSAGELWPHLHYVDTVLRGFVVVKLTPAQATATWWHFADGITEAEDYEAPTASLTLRSALGSGRWEEA